VVFPSPQRRLHDPNSTSGGLRETLDRAGFDRVTAHVFRKTTDAQAPDGQQSHTSPQALHDRPLSNRRLHERIGSAMRCVADILRPAG